MFIRFGLVALSGLACSERSDGGYTTNCVILSGTLLPSIGSFTFVQNRNTLFLTFFLRPKVDDFLWWKGMPGGVVYGRMMDLCCLYGPETTDSMDIEVKRG